MLTPTPKNLSGQWLYAPRFEELNDGQMFMGPGGRRLQKIPVSVTGDGKEVNAFDVSIPKRVHISPREAVWPLGLLA